MKPYRLAIAFLKACLVIAGTIAAAVLLVFATPDWIPVAVCLVALVGLLTIAFYKP